MMLIYQSKVTSVQKSGNAEKDQFHINFTSNNKPKPMKTNLHFIAAVVLIAAASHLKAQNIIHSTVNGGLWPTNTTWIEAVPSYGDSVVLQGPVSMLSYTGWCTSLNITPTGSLGGNGNQGTLYIDGSMYNDGDILGSINYNLQGNLVNNQPWTGVDNHLLFTGMNHSISCAAGASINAQLQAGDSLHNFSLLSDVILNTTSASDFGFSQLDAGNHKLTVIGGQFNNCRVHSVDTLQFDANISSLDLSGDYKLIGSMICYYNMAFYDKATNYGNIQFASGIGGDPLKLKGDFINEGTMSHAWVQVEKNISNHGIWNSFRTEFTGAGDKHISQSAGHPFGGGDQFMSDNSGSIIFLDTDVELTVPAFHLNNNTLNCGDHKLTSNTVFFDGTISSNAEVAGNNDFWTSTITGNVKLSGNNRFSNGTVDGVIENTGTMRDIQFYGGWFSCYNHLINRNSIQSLSMRVYGDLTNEGTINNNSIVEITGDETQYISLLQSIESPTRFYSDITGNTYQWTKDGADILSGTYDMLPFNTLQLTDAGTYQCRVVNGSGETVYSREIIVNDITSVPELPETISNLNAYPNPFTGFTTLKWKQVSAGNTRIAIADASGKEIRTVTNASFPAGDNAVRFISSESLKPGVYYARIISGTMVKTIKLIVVG
jgi:hypothetical protein